MAWEELHAAARRHLGRIGLDVDPRRRVDELGMAERQLVEIAKALSGDVRVLLLDEPTSALSDPEARRLFGIVRDLTSSGVAVVYVSHRLPEVLDIADRISVLRDGQLVGTVRAAEVDEARLLRKDGELQRLGGGEPGTEPETCPDCNGTGEQRRVAQTILGQMVNIVACPRCRGEGRIIATPCTECGGDGRVREERTLQVSIPAGIDDGQRIALEGEGEAGPRGGPNGDLYVAVKVRAHPQLMRRGTELYHELPITFPQAALGATLTVPTVEGSEEIEIPGGAQSGHEVRLRGKGVPRLRGAGRGDLHVIVNVVVPSKLSKRERELLTELNEISEPASLPKSGASVFDRLRDLFT